LTDPDDIRTHTIRAIRQWVKGAQVRLITDAQSLMIPENVKNYFESTRAKKTAPVLHRQILVMERDQVMGEIARSDLNSLIQYLDSQKADIVLPSFHQGQLVLLTFIRMETIFQDMTVNLSLFGTIYDILQDVGVAIVRLTRVEEEKEKDRLVLLGEMAAGLAHEVRNPLGAIKGAAELIPDSENPWAKVIQEEVSRLNRLVSQFLDFAQDPKDQREKVDLNDIAKASVQTLQASLHQRIEINAFAGGVEVSAVPDHVRQVLINLIQNSVKATEGRENPKIELYIEPYQIVVRDNGVGMSDEVKKKVFQPFFTSFKKGTGLGLSICQRLMSFNGGTIRIESELGRGTEVILVFPVSEVQS
jgi:signal transduction histidine kinase